MAAKLRRGFDTYRNVSGIVSGIQTPLTPPMPAGTKGFRADARTKADS